MPIPFFLLAAATDVSPPQAAAPVAKPKLVCRQSDQRLGSHIRSRSCKTAEEWSRIDGELDRIPPASG